MAKNKPAAGSIAERMLKRSTIKDTSILEDSKFFGAKDMIKTQVPAINIALSGEVSGGFTPGLTVWAGPSKHFKTSFTLLMIKAYLDKYADAVCLFYDNEFGTPQGYFKSFGIDPARVIHTPIKNIEQLKFDLIQQLEEITRDDHVIVAVDSVGNLASKKEVQDALEGSDKADMTRAKQLKSVFRMVTPYLTMNDIPMVVVNHTYKTQEMYSKDVVSGGTGIYYSADNIFILGRQQEKDGTELVGYNMIINVEKSRFVREKSKIPIAVSFEKGISKWSGLLDMALETGHVTKPKVGWYTRPLVEGDKNWREDATNCADFWLPLLTNTNFPDAIKALYKLAEGDMLREEDPEPFVHDDETEEV